MCFNPELYFKNSESAIENKLKKFIKWIKGYKFVITLELKFLNKTNKDKTKYSTFLQTQIQKKLFVAQALIVYTNQSIVQLWEKYKSVT